MVSAQHFAEVAENPSYNKYSYSDMDCQKFVERVLYDSGCRKPDGQAYDWKGSNSMWRSALSWRGTVAEAVEKFGTVPPGAWVFILKWDGGEKDRGYIDGEGNASHVGIYIGGDGGQEMEVKAATTGKNASGGHAAGQKQNNGQKIRGAWSIYLYLNKNLFNLGDDNAVADKSAYFQNNNGIKNFNQLIKDNKLDKDDKSLKTLSNCIVDALCFQYNFITNEKDSKNSLNTIDKLYDAAYIYCKSIYDNGFKKQDLFNLVGCIQLYLYSQVEQFDYFFAVQVDKSDTSTNPNNGNYWCVKNCKSNETDLLKFNKVLDNLYFGSLDSPVSSQGRTGKIYMKIKQK